MERVVVTGGAGFLGSHLCERLLDEGCSVVALDDFLTGTPENLAHLLGREGFQLVSCDMTDFVHVPGPVDQVLHFASPASPVDYPCMRPDDGRAIPAFIRQAQDGKPRTGAGDGSQTRSVCYVSDLVNGILRLLGSDHPDPLNIGIPHAMTVLDLARLIIEITGSASPIEFVPRPQDDPRVRQPDVALARTALGWEPEVPVRDGPVRTVEWFRPRSLATAS